MKKTAKYISIILGIVIVTIIIIGGGLGPANSTIINDGKVIVFAHRGVSAYNAENSIEAFDKAIEYGFNAIETDISCTKDGKLIVFHDKSCSRLLNIDKDIININWQKIENNFLQKNGKATKSRVLSLEQYLKHLNDSVISYLDIKFFSKSIADSLLSIVGKYNNSKKIIIADSDIIYLTYLKIKNPEIKVVLEGFNKGKEWLYFFIPKRIKPDFYSSFIDEVDENHMLFLKNNNLLDKKIVYGLNHENISKAYDLGLSNIIFDYDSSSSNIENIKRILTENKHH